jgi:hypothetical protein
MGTGQKPIKLHLGCGTYYLEGYLNIDLPADQHTVSKPRTDLIADFRTLSYEPGSVEEIRSHHVFEHFTRSQALRLLFTWRRWLRTGGTLHIETPDFDTACWYYVFSGKKARAEISRHIFGSQEAAWANHYDGWGARKYRDVLTVLGFTDITISKRSNSISTRFNSPIFNWVGLLVPNAVYRRLRGNKLPNITVIAKKGEGSVNEEAALRQLLSQYLVGTEGEELLAAWLNQS